MRTGLRSAVKARIARSSPVPPPTVRWSFAFYRRSFHHRMTTVGNEAVSLALVRRASDTELHVACPRGVSIERLSQRGAWPCKPEKAPARKNRA